MEDVIIIGAGPAGLTAGLYAARSGLKTLIFAGADLGGQLLLTEKIENFPGILSTCGADLIEKIHIQAETMGAKVIRERVTQLNITTFPFLVKTNSTNYFCKNLIIATGAKARWLGVKNEERFKGKGVSICVTCDGFFYKDKKVAVIGGGSSAAYEALFLTKLAKEIILICQEKQLIAEENLIKQLQENPKIKVMYQTKVIGFEGKEKLQKMRVINKKDLKEILIDGVFVAIGSEPNTDLVKGQLKLNKKGCIKTDKKGETSIKGVYAAGDVQQSGTRQAILAAASGCLVAINIKKKSLKR